MATASEKINTQEYPLTTMGIVAPLVEAHDVLIASLAEREGRGPQTAGERLEISRVVTAFAQERLRVRCGDRLGHAARLVDVGDDPSREVAEDPLDEQRAAVPHTDELHEVVRAPHRPREEP